MEQNEVAKQRTKVDVIKNILAADSVQEQFKNALKEGSGLFVASLIDLYNGDKYLQNCDPKSVVMEALKAAVLKLPINKALGFAYIYAFKNTPTFIIGYKGLIQLAMRTGQYKTINAEAVYEGELKYKNKLTGEYDLNGEATSDKVIGYFAHIEMLNGFSKTLYMTKEKVQAHAKKYSPSFGIASMPWTREFDAMATKTVLRNLLSHYGFLSVDMISAISTDIVQDTTYEEIENTINTQANKTAMAFEEVEEANEEENPI